MISPRRMTPADRRALYERIDRENDEEPLRFSALDMICAFTFAPFVAVCVYVAIYIVMSL